VCVSWKLKCWILLMHGVTVKFRDWCICYELGTEVGFFTEFKSMIETRCVFKEGKQNFYF